MRTSVVWGALIASALLLVWLSMGSAVRAVEPSSHSYLPLVIKPAVGTPTPSPTATATPTASPTATVTVTPSATATPSGYDYYLIGDPTDVMPPTDAGLMLMGGGPDVDAAFIWLIEHSGGGDVVVLRASGSDGYNSYLYSDLGGVDSVETIVTRFRYAANDPFVVETIQNAEALFIAGGDQWDYVSRWKGTALEGAVHDLVDRGVPIGGTSAGLAIMGEFLFSAQNGTVYSDEALADPYNPYMTLQRDFLTLPHMARTITDSHFYERDRMGRLVTFLARILEDGWAAEARGIGINEETALLVEADGSATLVGAGAAYFLRSTEPPQLCQPGMPLTFQNVNVYRIFAGQSFNLATWSGAGGTAYQLSAVGGTLSSTQAGGGLY